MTWTAPMTAVDGNYLTASQFNTYVRDNLNETAPAKATAAGYYFVPTGTNRLEKRQPLSSYDTNKITIAAGTSLAWIDGGGPAVSVVTGTSAMVILGAYMGNSVNASGSGVGFEVTGATNIPLSTFDINTDGDQTLLTDGTTGNADPASNAIRQSICFLQTGLTAGTNTFTMKYLQHTSGTVAYYNREILVLPL